MSEDLSKPEAQSRLLKPATYTYLSLLRMSFQSSLDVREEPGYYHHQQLGNLFIEGYIAYVALSDVRRR